MNIFSKFLCSIVALTMIVTPQVASATSVFHAPVSQPSVPVQQPSVPIKLPPSMQPSNDGCLAAQHNAMKQNGKPGDCVMVGSQGLVHLTFDPDGQVAFMTGVDQNNVGHHAEVRRATWPGVYVNNHNYRGPVAIDTIDFYESHQSQTSQPINPGATRTFDGRSGYVLVGTFTRTQKPAEHFIGLDTKLPETSTRKAYEDICAVFWDHAETEGRALVSEMGSQDGGTNWHSVRTVWTSGQAIPKCTNRYLAPYAIDASFFSAVTDRFVGTPQQIQAAARHWAAAMHSDWDADPLGAFRYAHQHIHDTFTHPLDGGGKKTNATGDETTFLRAMVAGGFFIVIAVATAGGEIIAVFGFTMWALVMDQTVTDWGNSPPYENHPPYEMCIGSDPPAGCEYWDTHVPSTGELDWTDKDLEDLAQNDENPGASPEEGSWDDGGNPGSDGPGGGDDPTDPGGGGGCNDPEQGCAALMVGRPK